MILEVQHETRLDYSEPVAEWLTELRMEPVSDDRQSCHSFHVVVSQPTSMFRYLDGFGNRVHHFNLLSPHQQVRLLAASVVETNVRQADLMSCEATFPLPLESAGCDVLDFLAFRGPVRETELLTPILNELKPHHGELVGAWIHRVGDFLRDRFEYGRFVTDATSPIDDILSKGKGVCQDFAHLMIAILRSFSVPARYVSGYVHRPNKESQSHAWTEIWLPNLNWVGFDPTHACLVSDRYVKVATGRDFDDVTPNKGVFRGPGNETIAVRVATRELDRVPPNSWFERLPPLDLPLTSVARVANEGELEQLWQQQQMQQQQ
jgi:transglutaminase-like putative cysteine protease